MRKPEIIAGTVFSVLLGCFWLGFSSGQDKAPEAEERSENGFNADLAELPRPLVAAGGRAMGPTLIASPMPLRDAVASPPRAVPAGVPAPASAPAASGGNSGGRMVDVLLSAPMGFIAKRTLLGRPQDFSAFLRDPRRMDGYLNHPLIRGVLDNPALLRRLLGSPALVQAFLASPAMQRPETVSALAASPLIARLAESRGVRAVMEDPAFVQGVLLDPQTIAWLAQNPRALEALSRLGPSAARALGSLPRPR